MAIATSQREDGYFDVTLDELSSPTAAITAEELDLRTEPGTPSWAVEALQTDVRLRATGTDGNQPIFLGIAREGDVDAYLAGVAHDEIRNVDNLHAEFLTRTGENNALPPIDQGFWEASTWGSGTQELEWETRNGQWAVVVMNVDGSPGVTVEANVGATSAAFLPAALGLVALGAVLAVGATVLIVIGGTGLGAEPRRQPSGRSPSPAGVAPSAFGEDADLQSGSAPYPLSIEAHLDPELSNWRWLIKWLLSIPHLIILFFLWTASPHDGSVPPVPTGPGRNGTVGSFERRADAPRR